MWNLICPYSISDRFERVEIDRNKCKTCTRGFLYSFLIKPHSLNRVFGIVTPKRIPNELDQKYMNFAMHYPEYEQRVMMRSTVGLKALDKYEVQLNDNEWKWTLEFNKILFQMLDPKLSHWWYCIKEIQSLELRNYLIVPLLHDKIDWKSIQNLVQYHYNKVKPSYEMKHLLIDLEQNQLDRLVLCQNGAYFVPLNASKQTEIARIKHLMDEQKDLHQMEQLLNDDDEEELEDEFYEQIMAKIGANVALLCMRFDKLNDFVTNCTDRKTDCAWITQPKLDIMDIGRNGVLRAPFDPDLFYTILKLPFILFEFERILRILQLIQSQQYRMQRTLNCKSYCESFWMKIPFLTLSKIMFCEARHSSLFKTVGKEIVTLIYSTSAVLSVLSSCDDEDMVQITQALMKESVAKFRTQLCRNHIFDYLSPSKLDWTPSRFYNMTQKKGKASAASHDISALMKSDSVSSTGRGVNEYLSIIFDIASDKSNQYLFCIQKDLFSSLWYGDVNELFVDCFGLMQWMSIDRVLSIDTAEICDSFESARRVLNVRNEYSLNSNHTMNSELQSMVCNVVRGIGYEFVYPCILMTMIDPFGTHNVHKRLSFELLYDLGSIVLNAIISLSCGKWKWPLLLYTKCLTSTKYLSYQCKYHRLYKHIIAKDKGKHIIDLEVMAAFIRAVVGAIYLDDNLHNNSPLKLQNVYRFIQTYLVQIVKEEELKHILYLFESMN